MRRAFFQAIFCWKKKKSMHWFTMVAGLQYSISITVKLVNVVGEVMKN